MWTRGMAVEKSKNFVDIISGSSLRSTRLPLSFLLFSSSPVSVGSSGHPLSLHFALILRHGHSLLRHGLRLVCLFCKRGVSLGIQSKLRDKPYSKGSDMKGGRVLRKGSPLSFGVRISFEFLTRRGKGPHQITSFYLGSQSEWGGANRPKKCCKSEAYH